MREKKLHVKEVKNHIFRRNWICRYTFCINNPDWQSGGIIIFLCKYLCYFRYTDRHFFGCARFDACCNITRATWETKKEWFHALLSMSLFMLFFVYSLPLSEWRTCWMFPIKIYSVAMEGILCDDIMSERSKIWKSLKYLAI